MSDWFHPSLAKLIDHDLVQAGTEAKIVDNSLIQLQLARNLRELANSHRNNE